MIALPAKRISRRLGLAILAAAALSGCATRPPADDTEALAAYKEANDPIEPLNRYFFELNRGIDQLALRPMAEAYRGLLPRPVRDSVRNFIDNLKAPVFVVNQVLQGEPEMAGDTVGRFMANTFIGVGGLFDVAPNLAKREEDFGQTLAVWGMGSGAYIVLPLLGPSNMRDTVGLAADYLIDPVNNYARNTDRNWIPLTRALLDGVDLRSRNIETLDEIERTSIDFYAAMRSLYRQRREDAIRNGAPKPESKASLLGQFEEEDSREGKSAALSG